MKALILAAGLGTRLLPYTKLLPKPMFTLNGIPLLQLCIEQLIREFGIVGAAAGSLFVFKGIYKAVLINYPSHVEKEKI